jgi:ferredoxin
VARRLRIAIDYDRCVGSGICVLTAPHVFEFNDQRQSSVIDPTGDPEELVLEAAHGCPQMAIFVEDADTGERLFPPPGLE